MCSQLWKRLREHLAFSLKCSSVLFLFLVSILVVACGANNTTQAPGAPPVTVTINLNQTFASPTPTMAPYSCGAWALNTTPSYSPGGSVAVYAKYVQNVDGNPQGMNATAQATISWPNGQVAIMNANTTSDGLAVFFVGMEPSALMHVVLVNVTFTSSDRQHTCTTPQAAFFTAIAVSPTPTPSPTAPPMPSPTRDGGGGPPTFTPGGDQTPTPTPRFGH